MKQPLDNSHSASTSSKSNSYDHISNDNTHSKNNSNYDNIGKDLEDKNDDDTSISEDGRASNTDNDDNIKDILILDLATIAAANANTPNSLPLDGGTHYRYR